MASFSYLNFLVMTPIHTSSNPKLIVHVNTSLKNNFEMIYLGHLHYFLGLQDLQIQKVTSPSEPKYACDLLRCFYIDDCKPISTPFQCGFKRSFHYPSPKFDATLYCQFIDNILYLTHTQLYIPFVVGLVS